MSPTPEAVECSDHVDQAEARLLKCREQINSIVGGIIARETQRRWVTSWDFEVSRHSKEKVAVVGFLIDNGCVTVLLGDDENRPTDLWTVGGQDFGYKFPAWPSESLFQNRPWGINVQWGGSAGKISYANCTKAAILNGSVGVLSEQFRQWQDLGFLRVNDFDGVMRNVAVDHHWIEDRAKIAEFFLNGLKRTAGIVK